MSLITQAEFARRRGFSRQYVNKLVRQGKIKLINGMIDTEETVVTRTTTTGNTNYTAAHTREKPENHLVQRASFPSMTENLNELLARVRLKNEIERGKILEAKAKAEINKLASAEKIRKAAFARARTAREKVLDVVDRFAPELAEISDASRIRGILTKELQNAMEELEDLNDENIQRDQI